MTTYQSRTTSSVSYSHKKKHQTENITFVPRANHLKKSFSFLMVKKNIIILKTQILNNKKIYINLYPLPGFHSCSLQLGHLH